MVSIRALQKDDDTSSFLSGNEDLDRFFRKYAARNQFAEHIGTTYVALEGDTIAGFATIAAANIRAEDFPSTRARKLPNYPLPALRLARLAVSRSSQNRGVGTALLRYVFVLALEMAERLGCIGVLVDAKPQAVAFYSRFGFEALTAIEGQAGGRPEPSAMFLHIETIRSGVQS